jgi:hypothetical protein
MNSERLVSNAMICNDSAACFSPRLQRGAPLFGWTMPNTEVEVDVAMSWNNLLIACIRRASRRRHSISSPSYSQV